MSVVERNYSGFYGIHSADCFKDSLSICFSTFFGFFSYFHLFSLHSLRSLRANFITLDIPHPCHPEMKTPLSHEVVNTSYFCPQTKRTFAITLVLWFPAFHNNNHPRDHMVNLSFCNTNIKCNNQPDLAKHVQIILVFPTSNA